MSNKAILITGVAGKQIYWRLEDLKNGMTDFSADSGY